jgi:hypothetical protein
VTVGLDAAGTAVIGPPEAWLDYRYYSRPNQGWRYDLSPDGTRMLVIGNSGAATADAGPPQIHIVQHWFEELKRLVPTP